eukprot:CAMPEP_0172590028 /NCGR_PEP_ID=MMETSP1068-20121228/8514_1 /TAXON_ID=35684 /ORGANISM="Pseudopedinella elastica, Strain CCMP716" /LENGTH=210 /DNA_ID=CAMNT_0013385715 /DNA_START=107 /DNA_END=739 /DNA_ORIENTATION=+
MSLEPKKMKVGELREALEARGLGTSGLKTELIHRLEMALDEEEFGVSAAPETAAPTQAAEPAAAEPAAAEPAAAEPAAAEAPAGAEKSSPAAEEKSKEGDSAGVPAAAADMSDIEKKKLERAKRFGIPIVEAKEETPGAAKEAKGKKGRSKPEADPELEAKKQARMARFGDVKSGLSAEEIAKRAERAKRFATEEDAKKEARAARFQAAS